VSTYPPYLVLPAALSHENIKLAAVFRSKARLPVVTYCDQISGCVLLRSAQPLVGLTQQTSSADQLLLNYCRLSGTFNSEKYGAFQSLILSVVNLIIFESYCLTGVTTWSPLSAF
jgi:hypothetical protein